MGSHSQGNKDPRPPDGHADLPQARVKHGWRISPVWIVPVLAFAFVAWLVYRTVVEAGPTITIRFKQGPGIQKGQTQLKYRGVQLGEVNGVTLSKNRQYVEIQVQLDHSAAGIARQGSQFWIVHPEVSMSGIRGLKTIVSGNYLQVEPGNGGETNYFIGLEEQPVIQMGSEKALHVSLLTARLQSITPGTPVLYRGVQVGETTKNALGPHAQTVELQVYIYPQFKNLVRKSSKFWNAGGVNLELGLLGVDITAHSVKTLISGALAFATPDPPDEPAQDGTVFRLYDKAQDEWLNWAPDIPLPAERTKPIEQPSE
jgi:paraquat-inducible protein B